jgi:hypothetical protein
MCGKASRMRERPDGSKVTAGLRRPLAWRKNEQALVAEDAVTGFVEAEC